MGKYYLNTLVMFSNTKQNFLERKKIWDSFIKMGLKENIYMSKNIKLHPIKKYTVFQYLFQAVIYKEYFPFLTEVTQPLGWLTVFDVVTTFP